MAEHHYRVIVKVSRYPWGVEGKVKEVAQKYFNLDDDPRLLYGRESGKLRAISLRLRFDEPIVKKLPEVNDQQLCDAITGTVLQFIEDLAIRPSELEIYETVTYGTEGSTVVAAAGGVGGGLGTKDAAVGSIIAIFGGILGYLIGRSNERVIKTVCDKLI
ncbi:hypothetical protein [Acidianus sp. RZ1]|uniref:hypothetical protein n=1 Tax=Acidianus sp. RZ1 TaxID=1540082 RepID=UPI0014921C3D|nr:hypothetical protein [Acidianus sp. RZ1]NON61255.1 hypothetical protein [Acidianus sp. RZ1]